MTVDERPKENTFWAIWVLVVVAVTVSLFLCSGCAPPSLQDTVIKVVTKEEKDVLVAEELSLPKAAKNIVKINEDWHTFELMIDGRTRKFLRRAHNLRFNNATEAFTELSPQ